MKAAGVATAVAGNDDWITHKESPDPKVLPNLPGDKFFYKGIRMLLLFDDQVLMVIPDPADLDPNYLDINK